MTDAIALLVGTILRLFRARRTLLVENLALRLIGHDRRRILHFNVTEHPASRRIVSSCGKRFRSNLRRGFLSLTAIANMEQRFPLPFDH
jgi:hypothetical protein